MILYYIILLYYFTILYYIILSFLTCLNFITKYVMLCYIYSFLTVDIILTYFPYEMAQSGLERFLMYIL